MGNKFLRIMMVTLIMMVSISLSSCSTIKRWMGKDTYYYGDYTSCSSFEEADDPYSYADATTSASGKTAGSSCSAKKSSKVPSDKYIK